MALREWLSSKNMSYWKIRLLVFLSVVGPGIITGSADDDAGGIATYSIAGAHYGYSMLWLLIVITFMLYVTQEIGARLGVVTGKGFGDLIRENLGLRFSVFLMCIAFIANFTNVLADVAGVMSVADIYNFPRYIFVPAFSIFMFYIIVKGNFKFIQNIFLTSCILFFCYVINGFIARPDIPAMIHGSFVPVLKMNRDYIFTATALIGTTITVWGQIFIQSYFVDKGIEKKHIKSARLDVMFGAFWTDFVGYFIIISAAATLYARGLHINSAVDAAVALGPLLGPMAKHLFAWGLLNASLLGACVISMSTAYIVSEVLGTERKVDASFKEAPLFYSVIGFCIFASTILVFIPNFPIISVLTASQAINTICLPVIFIVLLRLVNDKKLMGRYTNGPIANLITYITIISFTLISFLMLYLMYFK